MKNKKFLMFLMVSLLLVSLFVGAASADGVVEADTAAPASSFTVDVDGEVVEYDLSDGESAQAYVDSYADNLTNDQGFKDHIQDALAKVRESVGTYATFWSLLPALIAIILALITKAVYSRGYY